jgi:hypothetical protein
MDAERRAQLERTFKTDGCDRLAAATQDYYSTHGEYVPPLAALLNETRAERDRLRVALEDAVGWADLEEAIIGHSLAWADAAREALTSLWCPTSEEES